jgi:hypothetical protein
MGTLFLMLFIAIVPAPQSSDRASLEDISKFGVMVKQLSDAARADGLDADQIKTDVQLKLRLAGMRVVDESEKEPHLYVNIVYRQEVNADKRRYVAYVEIRFRQKVSVDVNDNDTIASTWIAGRLLSGPAGEAQDQVKKALNGLLDEFTNDYLAENPK